jgi:peroxiredoxin Q/BCP
MMNRLAPVLKAAALAALLLAPGSPLSAQAGTTSQAVAHAGPQVGDQAPDFSLTAVTRYGALRDPVRLSALRGQTVVLAFFYKARTKG